MEIAPTRFKTFRYDGTIIQTSSTEICDISRNYANIYAKMVDEDADKVIDKLENVEF